MVRDPIIISPSEWLRSVEDHWASLSSTLKNWIMFDLLLLLILGLLVLATEPADATTYFNPPAHTLSDATTATAGDVNGNFTGLITDGNAAIALVETALSGVGGSGMPSGAVIMINNSSCPTGYRVADGTNGSPDARGVYIRGTGGAAAALGVLQLDEMIAHNHSVDYLGNLTKSGQAWPSGATAIANTAIRAATTTGLMFTGVAGSETKPDTRIYLHCYKT